MGVTNKNVEQEHFSVVSYNVLADDYTKPHYFEYASSEGIYYDSQLFLKIFKSRNFTVFL